MSVAVHTSDLAPNYMLETSYLQVEIADDLKYLDLIQLVGDVSVIVSVATFCKTYRGLTIELPCRNHAHFSGKDLTYR